MIARVDTCLRSAEAVNRLDLTEADQSQALPELIESAPSGGAKSKTRGVIEGAKEALTAGDEKQQSRTRRRRS